MALMDVELSQIGERYESEEKSTPRMDFLDVVRLLVPNTKFNGSKDLAIFANIMERARYSRNSIRALDHVLNALKSLQEDNLEGFYPVLQNMTLIDFLQLPVSLPNGDLGSIQDLANLTNHIPVTNNTDLHVLQQIVELWTQSLDNGDQKISLHPLVHLFQSLGDNNHIKDNVQELLNLTMITKHLHTISPDSRKISDILNTLQHIFEENSDQSVVEGDELNFIDILDSLIDSREGLTNVSQMALNEFDGSLAQLIAGAASQRLENIGNFDELLRVVFHPQHLHDFPEKSDRLADIIGSLGRIKDEELANGINPDLEILNKLFSNLQSNVSTVEVLKRFLLDLEALQSGTSYQESTNPHIAMGFMDSMLHILPSNEILDRGITNLPFLTKLIQDSEGHRYKGRLPILAQFLRDLQHLQMTPYLGDLDVSPANISYADFLQLLGDGGFSEDEVISMQQLANLTNHFDNGNASDEFLHLVKLLDLLQPPQKKTANEPEPQSSSLLNMFLNPRDRYDTIADMDELRGMIPLSELLNGPVKDMVVDEIRGLIDSNSNRHFLQIIKLVHFLRNAIHRGYHTSSGDMGMLQTLSTFASLWKANLTSSNAISYENLLKDLGNIENDQQYLGQGDTEPLVHFLILALGKDDWNPVEFDRLSHFADMLDNVSTAINTSEVQRMMMDMWFKPPQHPDQRYLKFFSDMQSNVHVLSNEDLVKLNELVKAHADSFKEHDPNALPDVLSIIGGSEDERLSSLMHFLVSQQFPDSYEPNDILMMQNVVNIIKRFIPTLTDENVAEITKLFTSQVDHQGPFTEYLRLMLALRDAVAANRSLDMLTELKSLTKGLPPFGDRSLKYEDMEHDIKDLLKIFDTRNTDQGDVLNFINTLAKEPYRPSWPWSNSVLPKLKQVAFHGHLPKNLGDDMLSSFAGIFGQSRAGPNDQLMSLLDDVKEHFQDSYEPNDILMMQKVVNITKRFIPTLTDENVAEITELFTSQVDHQKPITEYLRLMLALRDAVAANRSLDVLTELKSITKGLSLFGDSGLRYDNMTNDIQDLLRLFDTSNTDKGDILSFIDTLANEPYQPSWPWSNSVLPKLKDVAFHGHLPKNLGDDMLSSFAGIFGQSQTGANDQLMSLLDDVKETDNYQPSSIDVVAELDRHETIKQWMKDSKSALRSYLESVNDVLGSATQSNAASFLDFLDYTDMYKDADEFNRPILDLKNLSSIIPRPLGNARATTSIYEELLKQFGPEVPHPPLLAFVDALQEMFSQPDIDVSNDPTKLNKMGSYLENIPLPMTTALDDIHSILIKTEGAKSYLDYMEDMLTSLTGIGTGVLPKLESLQDLEDNGLVDLLQRSSSPLVDKAILDDLDKLLGQKTSAEMFAAGLEATLQDEGMRNDINQNQTSALLNNYQKDIIKMVAFQQYFGDLGDIVDVISQYSTLKESIHKPGSDILDLFGDVQEFPNETSTGELFQDMHTFQENITAYGNDLENTIQLLASIFDLTSPEFINENEILLNAFTDIAIHSENITKDESKLLYQRIEEHFEEPSEPNFMELLGNITLMLLANPEIEIDEHFLNVIEGIDWTTDINQKFKKLRNIVDEMRGIQGLLKQNASEILQMFTPLLVPSSNEITEQDNSDMFELFEGLAHVDDETTRNVTIALHEDIHNKFLEVPYSFSREIISELLSVIDTASSDKMSDKLFLKLVDRFAAVKNDTHQMKLVHQLFEDMMTSVSWSYNETMPRLIEDILHLHKKKKLFPVLDFIQTILVTNETEIENEQENMKIYDAMNRHVASPISFQDFTRYLDSIQDVVNSENKNDLIDVLETIYPVSENASRNESLALYNLITRTFNETVFQDFTRYLDSIQDVVNSENKNDLIDVLETIYPVSENASRNESLALYKLITRTFNETVFQDFTRYLDSIQDVVNSENKNDLIDVLETIYPVSENASRNESLALYKLITRTFNETVFPRGPIEGLVSFLWKASRNQSHQKILNSKADDMLFLRLVDKVRIIKNESQHRLLLRRTFNDMIYRASMRYNRTISSILEDILLLPQHEEMPPVLDLLQKLGASNESRIGNKEANLKMFDDMNHQVPNRFQLPDFTRFLKDRQYLGEPRAPEVSTLVSFLQNASNFRYLKQSESKWVDYFRLITNTSASATEDVLRTFDTLGKQSRQGTALLTVDQGTELINILKNISDGQWIHRDDSSWRSIYGSFENASSASQGKHLNEFIKHLFGEVRNEDLSDGIFLDMIEGLQNKSLLTHDRVLQWMEAFRAIRKISLKELNNTLGSLLEIMSSLDAVLERPQPYPSPREEILGFFQNITELSMPLQKSDSLNSFNEMIHRLKQTEDKLYPGTVKGNRRLLLQLDSLFNPEEFERKKREHVLLEFLLKIPRLLNASELDDGDVMALQQINDFDYFDESIYEERPPEDNRGKGALVDDFLGVMQKLVRVNLNVWNNSFPQFIGQSPSTSQQGIYDLHRMYYSLAEGIRMMSKAFHGIVSLLQNPAPTVEPEPTTMSPETNDLDNFLNQVSNMSQLKTEPDLTRTIQRFSQLTAIVKNSNGSELEDVVELLSSFFGPRREKTDEWRLENTDSIDNWSEWTAWSTCSVTCGHGVHGRRRTCSINIEGLLIASDQCVGKAEEISECQVECQEVSWAGWSFWSRCDNRCGGGNQTRSRPCGSNPTETNAIHPVNHFCNGSSEEKKMCQEYDFDECSLHEMFVPGTWSEWSAWAKCPDVCKGYRDRQRSCHPLNETTPIITRMKRDEGLLCAGDAKENVSCEYSTVCLTKMPPVINANAPWTSWSPWSRCNNRCGVGNQTRSRRCQLTDHGVTNATHSGIHSCYGDSQEKRTCSEYDFDECTLHDVFAPGAWGEWGQWSECSDNCTGHRNRHRLCHPLAEPTPIITRMKRDEGLLCEGDAKENVTCGNSTICWKKMHPVIIASWTAWSPWSRCNNRCGVGNQTRSRQCQLTDHGVTIAAHHGNHSCYGDSQEKRTCSEYDFDECTLHDVFEPGAWGEWGQWSECSDNCVGHRNRHRLCHPLVKPTPIITRMKRDEGLLCEGDAKENVTCGNSIVCWEKMHPVSIASWTAWSPWSRCNNKCGVGNQTRSRRCPLTDHGGTNAIHENHCYGDSQEKRTCSEYDFDECTLHDVFAPGTWSEWGQWSKSSENCTGHRNRHRICHPLAEQTSMITRMKRGTGLLCEGNSTQNYSCTSSDSVVSLHHHHHFFEWHSTSKPVLAALAMIGFVLFVILIIWYFATTRRRRGDKPYRTDRGNSEGSVFQTKRSSSDDSRRSSSRRSFLSWRSTSKESALFSDQQSEESVRLLGNEEIPPDPSRFCPYRGRPRSSKEDISAEWLYPWETEGDDWAGLDFEADNASNMNFDVYMEVDEAVEEPQTSVVLPEQEPSAVGNRSEDDQEIKIGELEKSAEAWFD
eukprot:XP_011681446.1 PREDICTED: uncharacterized protein LOC105446389 [Strongylocentrotus purpuratus]